MFALINFVLDATDQFPTAARMLTWLKIRIGHYEEHLEADGRLVYVPRSISFASMPQDAFEVFYRDALEAIRRELFPTMSDHDIDAALGFYEGSR